MRATRWMLSAFAFVLIASSRPARADVGSDQAAAMLVYPYVTVDSAAGTDTLLQITNTSSAPVVVRCLYESGVDLHFGEVDVKIVDFQFQLTPRQPIAWRASQGLAALPLDGVSRVGPDGEFNEHSQIPPVFSDPSIGLLRCIAVDRNLVPAERNVLVGTATVGQRSVPDDAATDAAQYRAIGIPARVGAGNGDNTLVLGGPNAEYDACPRFSVLPHFFDDALEPAARTSSVSTTLILVPCTLDLSYVLSDESQVMYEVINEFEQRFGTSQKVKFQQVSTLSEIGGGTPDRSIFNVQMAGTLTGQTRIEAVNGSGVLALAIQTHRDLSDPRRVRRAAFTAHRLGTRDEPDTFVLPPSTAQPTVSPTFTGTPTATPQVPTRTPTATRATTPTSTATITPTATAAPTNTATTKPTSTPSATQSVPTPTAGSKDSCSIAAGPRRNTPAAVALLLGPALLLLLRRARKE